MNKTLALLMGLCLAAMAHAQTSIHELYGFTCGPLTTGYFCPEGAEPAALIQASDGKIYGVAETSYAAHGTSVVPGGGTIFTITPAGQLTVLYTFPRDTKTGLFDNGGDPSSIAEGSDGLLYGVASDSGLTSASSGTLWRIHKDGTGFQVLERYCTSCTTGSFPNYIMAASDGNLYGTTGNGGSFSASICQGLGCGVVFRLTTGGAYTVLHAFNGTTDTSYPLGITQASDGNFYGATGSESGGGLFRVTASGSYTNLFTFGLSKYALAPLTQASNGLLYGFSHVTSAATIEFFSLSLSGVVNNIETITQPLFKQYGIGKLLQATDGNLWTSAAVGGAGYGRVFSITPTGTIVDSLNFANTVGSFPTGGLIQTLDGTLYGTTTQLGTAPGGGFSFGVIYTISGLPAR